jgi:hypothetical protein
MLTAVLANAVLRARFCDERQPGRREAILRVWTSVEVGLM